MQGFYTFSVTAASCQLVLTQSVAATPGMRGYARIPYFFVTQDVHAAGKKRHTCPPARQPARLHASMPAYTPFTYHRWPGSVCPLACMRDFSFLECSSIHWRLTHWFTITSLLNLLVLLHHWAWTSRILAHKSLLLLLLSNKYGVIIHIIINKLCHTVAIFTSQYRYVYSTHSTPATDGVPAD